MSKKIKKSPESFLLPVIFLFTGLGLFLAVLNRAKLAEFLSRLPNEENGFCAIAAIVILTVFTVGALIVTILSKFQKR